MECEKPHVTGVLQCIFKYECPHLRWQICVFYQDIALDLARTQECLFRQLIRFIIDFAQCTCITGTRLKTCWFFVIHAVYIGFLFVCKI